MAHRILPPPGITRGPSAHTETYKGTPELVFGMPLRLGADAYTYSGTLMLMCADLYGNPGATRWSWGLESDAHWDLGSHSNLCFCPQVPTRTDILVIALNLPFHLGAYTQTCTRSLVLPLIVIASMLRLSYSRGGLGVCPSYTLIWGSNIQMHARTVVFTLLVEFRTHIQTHPCVLLVYGMCQGSWGEEQRLL